MKKASAILKRVITGIIVMGLMITPYYEVLADEGVSEPEFEVETETESVDEVDAGTDAEAADEADAGTDAEAADEVDAGTDAEAADEVDAGTDAEAADEANDETEIEEDGGSVIEADAEFTEYEVIGAASNTKVKASYVEAYNTYTSVDTGECINACVSNRNANDYGTSKGSNDCYAHVVYSYLAYLSDGQILRFQATANSDEYVVQYYDTNLNVLNCKKINAELPVFGGFYYDGTSFYVLSGQNNPSGSNSVEVFRITKYDKNWNRYSTVASLNGANTTIPFDAGSARFVSDGDMLAVRTCHEMYSGHQASVMIQVNTKTMKVVGSQYSTSNSGAGYISHSFNQFIILDEGYMVAVDHGDAYPRGMTFLRYKLKYNSSSLTNSTYSYNILSYPGAEGENWTGSSIGGLAASSTNYLVAYALNDQQNYVSSTTRNIYIASFDKNKTGVNTSTGNFNLTLNDINYIQFTDYAEGETSVRNPFLVKLGKDSFLLMWSRGDKVYYCNIDGYGNLVGNIYYMKGELSDCEPIKVGNKVIWDVSYDEEVTFYSINYTNLAYTETRVMSFGHNYEITELGDGKSRIHCNVCGETKEVNTVKNFTVYYNHNADYFSSYSSFRSTMTWDCSKPFKFWVNYIDPTTMTVEDLYISSSDRDIIKGYEMYDADKGSILVGTKAGTTELVFGAKYTTSIKKVVKVTVTHHYSVTGTKENGRIQVETCSGCGAVKETELYSASYSVGGASAHLTDKIAMDFVLENLPANSFVVAEGSSGKVTQSVSSLKKDSAGRYLFTYEIMPRYMRESFQVYVIDSTGAKVQFTNNGTTYNGYSFKLINYLQAVAESSSSSSADKNLAQALIKYCDNTAYYFGDNSSGLGVIYTEYGSSAGNGLSGFVKGITSSGTNSDGTKNAEYLGSSLIMQDVPKIRHYFYGDFSKVTVTIGGVACNPISVGGNIYYCDAPDGISLATMSTGKEVKLTDKSSGEIWKMNYSILSYCYDGSQSQNAVLRNLCISIYNVYLAEKSAVS